MPFSDLLLDIPYTELCFVEGGTFTMGNGSKENNPAHEVSLSDFWLGRYPVIQGLYEAIMGTNPSHFKENKHPVEHVSWFDAILFCNKLSLKLGKTPCYYSDKAYNNPIESIANFEAETEVYFKLNTNGYRLPTEAEWEYAAKGGINQDNYLFAGSNTLNQVGWFNDNSPRKTQPPGLKKANSLGIYDLSGNVWEWCYDWFATDYYINSEHINPLGPNKGTYRVLRGGCWNYFAQRSQITARSLFAPTKHNLNIGIRLCCRS